MSWIQALEETLLDPRLTHAALVHLPIAGGIAGAPLALLCALRSRRQRALARLLVGWYLVVAAAAGATLSSGEGARALLGVASPEARELVERHAALARWVWRLALIPTLGLAGWLAAPARAGRAALVASALAALALAGLVGVVGHLGGTAVYRYGAGVERRARATPASDVGGARSSLWQGHVQPLLERSCVGCHGPGESAGGRLDLTGVVSILRGGSRGPAVVPGAPERSLLWQAVAWTHDTLRMPLAGERLSSEELGVLRRWIEEGATGDELVPRPAGSADSASDRHQP